jgi:hypothetical protein
VLLSGVALAQGQDTPPPLPPLPQVQPPPLPQIQPPAIPQPFLPGGDLLSAKAVEKLALSKEQKADYDKIADEYKAKKKEFQDKLTDIIKAPDPNALKAHFEAQQKLRPDYLSKVEKLMTDEQKKTLATVRNEFPGININVPAFPPPLHPFGPAVGAQFLPAEAQKQLKLTDDQKKKVDELQKELETKIMGLLTDEQKKAFEEMKKRPGGFGGIGFPPPPPILPPPVIDPPKLPLPLDKVPPPPALDKNVVPPPPAVGPTRPPEVKKIEKIEK